VGVLGHGLLGALGPQELAAHAQVNDQDAAAVQAQQQLLALAGDAPDLARLQLGDEVLLVLVPADGAHPRHVDGADLPARDLPVEVPPDGLDLGQLRHREPPRPPPPPVPPDHRRVRSPPPAGPTGPATPCAPPPARPASWNGPRPVPAPRRPRTRWRRSAWRDRGHRPGP